MRNVEKIVCILLVIVLSFSFSIHTFALEANSNDIVKKSEAKTIILENFGYMMDRVLQNAELYGVELEKNDKFLIMDPVSFNTLDDEGNDTKSILHFPIVNNMGKICLIYDVIFTENGYSTTIGADFAPLLNSIYENKETSLVLIQEGYSFYALSDEVGLCQQGNNVTKMSSLDYQKFTTYTTSSTEMKVSSLNINSELSKIAQESYITYVDTHTEIRSSDVTGTRTLNNYPIVDQTVNGQHYSLCWAATVASIVRFEKPSLYGTLTAKDVADYMNIGYGEGGTNAEVKTALNHYLGSPYEPTIKRDVLTLEQIKTAIDNIDPAYLQCRRKVGFLQYKYHAVAMFGYTFTSNYAGIDIMEPTYACYRVCYMDSDGDWTFSCGEYAFTWIKTVRLLYS